MLFHENILKNTWSIVLLYFRNHCGNKEANKKRCDKARKFSSLDFAERLNDKVESLKNNNRSTDYAYIASPKSESQFISSTAQHMSDILVWYSLYYILSRTITLKVNDSTASAIDLLKPPKHGPVFHSSEYNGWSRTAMDWNSNIAFSIAYIALLRKGWFTCLSLRMRFTYKLSQNLASSIEFVTHMHTHIRTHIHTPWHWLCVCAYGVVRRL